MLIIKVFFKTLTYSTINSGKVYYVPNKLGIIGIAKRRTVGRGAFDYQLYKEQGLKVWRKNTHSGMYAAKIFWKTIFPRFNVKTIYPNNIFKFTPCREYSRYLSKQIKEQNTISKYYDY